MTAHQERSTENRREQNEPGGDLQRDAQPSAERRAGVERRSGGDRRRGRPPLAADVSQMSFKLPSELHDRLLAAAARRESDVSDTVRVFLEFALDVETLFRISKM